MSYNEFIEKMCDADLRTTSRLASEVSANLIINADEYGQTRNVAIVTEDPKPTKEDFALWYRTKSNKPYRD